MSSVVAGPGWIVVTGTCSGGVGLVAAAGKLPARAAAQRPTAARYGRKAYRVAAGKRKTIGVGLPKGARRQLARRGDLRARLIVRRTGAKRTVAAVTLVGAKARTRK